MDNATKTPATYSFHPTLQAAKVAAATAYTAGLIWRIEEFRGSWRLAVW